MEIQEEYRKRGYNNSKLFKLTSFEAMPISKPSQRHGQEVGDSYRPLAVGWCDTRQQTNIKFQPELHLTHTFIYYMAVLCLPFLHWSPRTAPLYLVLAAASAPSSAMTSASRRSAWCKQIFMLSRDWIKFHLWRCRWQAPQD